MQAEDKLIRFMRAKARKLRTLGIPESLYWNKKDEASLIYMLQSRDANQLWYRISEPMAWEDLPGLPGESCPFCLIYNSHCPDCGYGKNHGYCPDTYSDYGRIKAKLSYGVLDGALSMAWYKSLIKRIEKSDKG